LNPSWSWPSSKLVTDGIQFHSCLVVKQGWIALVVQVVMTWSTLELLKMMVSCVYYKRTFRHSEINMVEYFWSLIFEFQIRRKSGGFLILAQDHKFTSRLVSLQCYHKFLEADTWNWVFSALENAGLVAIWILTWFLREHVVWRWRYWNTWAPAGWAFQSSSDRQGVL
jgi:hypothetical protein